MPISDTSENRALRAENLRMKEVQRRLREEKDRKYDAYEPRFDVVENRVSALEVLCDKAHPATPSAAALETVEEQKKRMRPEVAQSLSLAGGGGIIVLLTELVRWLSTM